MKKTIFLTGAGISKASGIPTYRGKDGYYTNNPERYSELLKTSYRDNTQKYWDYILEKRSMIQTAKPNKAHHLLREIENKLQDKFLLVTQNVDSLHSEAGSSKLLELHGNIWSIRYTSQDKQETYLEFLRSERYIHLGYTRLEYLLEMCNSECSTIIKQTINDSDLLDGFRPNVTFFNDSIANRLFAIHEFLKDEVFEVYLIGTSLEVSSVFTVLRMIKEKWPNVKIYNANPEANSEFIDMKFEAIFFLEGYLNGQFGLL